MCHQFILFINNVASSLQVEVEFDVDMAFRQLTTLAASKLNMENCCLYVKRKWKYIDVSCTEDVTKSRGRIRELEVNESGKGKLCSLDEEQSQHLINIHLKHRSLDSSTGAQQHQPRATGGRQGDSLGKPKPQGPFTVEGQDILPAIL